MTFTTYHFALWLHLLCMVGIFGALLVLRLGLPAGARADTGLARSILRLATQLLIAGVVLGVAVYLLQMRAAKTAGGALPAEIHMVVGFKFVLMLVVGGGLGMSSAFLKKGKPAPAGMMQWVALAALALASFLGVIL